MNPIFPSDSKSHAREALPTPAAEAGILWDALGNAWSAADTATAAERGAAYLARQVLPAFDPSDPRSKR